MHQKDVALRRVITFKPPGGIFWGLTNRKFLNFSLLELFENITKVRFWTQKAGPKMLL